MIDWQKLRLYLRRTITSPALALDLVWWSPGLFWTWVMEDDKHYLGYRGAINESLDRYWRPRKKGAR